MKNNSDKDSRELLTYSHYLRIDQLLQLQHPLSKPVAHDEMLFIIIHQAYELWFKLVLFELDTLVKHLDRDEWIQSERRLDRVGEIFRMLVQKVDILETMTPVEFNRFRGHLNPASGFQSLQFRELEILGGCDPQDYEKFAKFDPEWRHLLTERSAKRTLRDALTDALMRQGLLTSTDSAGLTQGILKVYLDPSEESPLRGVLEGLIRFDETVSLWRFRHVQMVERMIGMKSGTGGSLGVGYLQTTLKKRFFPELWEARTGISAAHS